MPVLTLSDLRGRTVVLARAPRWAAREEDPRVLARMRAELRGLGAIMVALGADATWLFSPDDELERHGPVSEGLLDDVDTLGRAHGIASGAAALFVIDDIGRARFAEPLDEGGAFGATVARALEAAGRELLRAPAPLAMTRREWALASLASGFALALSSGCAPAPPRAPVTTTAARAPAGISGEVDVALNVNGEDVTVKIEPRTSLLDALRDGIGLTGTKRGCDQGQCGACTVHVDGRRALACLVLAMSAQGKRITTIEGLARGGQLHPVQRAFIAEDGLQCGFCTPGQIMSAVALLREGGATSDDAIREHMSGNLCRCGAYPNIVAAIRRAKGA